MRDCAFLFGFFDELEKLADKTSEMWPTLSQESRQRLWQAARQGMKEFKKDVGEDMPKKSPLGPGPGRTPRRKHLTSIQKQKLRQGLFAPIGEESKVPELRADVVRQKLHKEFPPTRHMLEMIRKGVGYGAYTTRAKRTGRVSAAAPRLFTGDPEKLKRLWAKAPKSPEELKNKYEGLRRKTYDITSPEHEYGEAKALSRPFLYEAEKRIPGLLTSKGGFRHEVPEHATQKEVAWGRKHGIPLEAEHGGIEPIYRELVRSGHGSPSVQRMQIHRYLSEREKPWMKVLKEHGWTPSSGLPERPGMMEKMERRVAQKQGWVKARRRVKFPRLFRK